jgi:hypothetical protein
VEPLPLANNRLTNEAYRPLVKRCALIGLALVFAVPASATTTRILPSQDAWPVWSPGGGRIAFTRISGNAMGLEVLTLGRHSTIVEVARNAGQLSPSWSSNGRTLAYAAGGSIYTVDGTGHRKRRLSFPGAAYAPTFRPGGSQIAYLTTHGARNTDLWVDGALWARDVIGNPAWNDDGTLLAAQRDDGLYVLDAPDSERKLVSVANPGEPVWHDNDVVYAAQGRIWKVSAKAASPQPVAISPKFPDIGTPTFNLDGDLFYPRRGGLEVTTPGSHESGLYIAGAGLGAAFSSTSDKDYESLAYAGPHKGCPGHIGLRLRQGPMLDVDIGISGSCVVRGTPTADEIEGSPREGDVILAGAGNDRIHANDGHTDRVDCGPGRDTVWADRVDRLAGCEIVHH